MERVEESKGVETLYVFKQNELAGKLTRGVNKVVFTYDEGYILNGGISICSTIKLPQREHVNRGDSIHPFFAGLLPEGRRLTGLIKAIKTSSDDLFSILVSTGTNNIGDVFITPNKSLNSSNNLELSEDFNQIIFNDIFEKSISSSLYSVRNLDSSIAGVQPKLSDQMITFPVGIKKRNKKYIIKLTPKNFPNLVTNEHYFMQLAKKCGFSTADTKIIADKNNNLGLLVERFDRGYDSKKRTPYAIAQEDACQFLNRYPSDKYRVSYNKIAERLTTICSAPKVEILKLINLIAYSYIIYNGDLHAKNISIHSKTQSNLVILSPFYDLVSTLPYGDQKMAISLEGRDRNFKLKDFINFGKRWKIPEKSIAKSINKISKIVLENLGNLEETRFKGKKLIHLRKSIIERAQELVSS